MSRYFVDVPVEWIVVYKNSKINLPYFCTLACPERFAEIYKKIKNHKSPHGVGIKTVFESQKTWQQGKRQY